LAENDHISVEDQSLSFRQIIDSAPALLHTAQPNGYLDFFNQTWVDFAGEPLEKLLGWGWIACIHPEDVEAFVEKMRESFAKGRKPFQETSRIRRADGVCRWMLHHKEASLLRTDEKFVPVRGRALQPARFIIRSPRRSCFDAASAGHLPKIGRLCGPGCLLE